MDRFIIRHRISNHLSQFGAIQFNQMCLTVTLKHSVNRCNEQLQTGSRRFQRHQRLGGCTQSP
ncbi:hypothetical protein BKH38_04410 [Actinomyces naeslundii]|nr:hypothetical protein BKH38_04410 [Actinomyces naeslundii]